MSGGMEECAKREKKTKKMNVKKEIINTMTYADFKQCDSFAETIAVIVVKLNEIIERVNKWEK